MLLVKLIEPPCTERYARWCERSEFLNQEKFLLLDLQEDNRMAYRVKAYTLREESTESGTRYFISFKDGQGKSHELEVSEQFFMEFRQMERRNRNLF